MRISLRLALLSGALFCLWASAATSPLAEAGELRIGTIAPPGSKWGMSLRKAAKEVQRKTRGAVKMRFSYVDIAGDEGEVFKMIEEKKLDGAAITGVGIERIAPAFLVQQLPLIFRSYEELDCLRAELAPKLDAMFTDKGWVPLAYSDVGFVYVFTKDEVKSPEQLEKIKMWGWEQDKIGLKMLELAGITPLRKPLPDVFDALRKGQLEGFYGSAYGVAIVHWHDYVGYMLQNRLALVVGAIVVPRTNFEALVPPEHRTLVREILQKHSTRVNKVIRRLNKKARQAFLRQGIKPVRLSAGESSLWRTIAEKTHRYFEGKLYSKDLLAEVKSVVAACRKKGQ